MLVEAEGAEKPTTTAAAQDRLSLGTVPLPPNIISMLITLGWASLAALFSFSIAMVVWGRHGDGSINF